MTALRKQSRDLKAALRAADLAKLQDYDALTARVAELEAALAPFARWPVAYRQDGLRDAYAAAEAAIFKAGA